MGEHQSWPSHRNGIPIEASPSPSPSNPHPSSISDAILRRAEETTGEIIRRVQPTVVSEQRRKAVVDYVQRLIRGSFCSEVLPFGSVPLKTYLPDGDIDLTALCYQTDDDDLANNVLSLLKREEKNKAAEFEVKDARVIVAEVKLVKCLVQNIVVDISFNQLGGLCTLCFLEQDSVQEGLTVVDLLIDKDNLFKRSIILIKAWCYYESRILGAHHNLISTYALETMVLYRFLDYFSKFDWDNYCLSLNGPVSISSLPGIVADTPETEGGDLLLSKDFLKNCLDMFSVPSRGLDNSTNPFPQKHLNIVDPLKENNNLGRSVSKGNFYRIRSAFTYGARKLGRILRLPGESISDELTKFFMNTLDRHGSRQRPDVQDSLLCCQDSMLFGVSRSGFSSSVSDVQISMDEKMISGYLPFDFNGSIMATADDHSGILYEFNNVQVSSPRINSIATQLERQSLLDEPQTSYKAGLTGDAKDFATTSISGLRIVNGPSKPFCSGSELHISPLIGARHMPGLHFSYPFKENGNLANGNPYHPKSANSSNGKVGVVSWADCDRCKSASNNTFQPCDNYESPAAVRSTDSSDSSDSNGRGIFDAGSKKRDSLGISASPEASNHLSDLHGDYNSHLKNLLYGQWCYDYILCSPDVSVPLQLPPQFHSKHSRNIHHQPTHLKPKVPGYMNGNGASPRWPLPPASRYYMGNPPLISGFGVEEMPRSRGTGTYFPIMTHHSYRPKARNLVQQTHSQLPRPDSNGRAVTPPDSMSLPDRGSQKAPDPRVARVSDFSRNGQGKPPDPLEFIPTSRPDTRRFLHANGITPLPAESLKFGTFDTLHLGAATLEQQKRPDYSAGLQTQGSGSIPQTSTMPRAGLSVEQERTPQSYHLKDEDFPPLSVSILKGSQNIKIRG